MHRKADPDSKRSQKRKLRLALKQGDHDAVIAAHGEFRQRQHSRDNRCRDYVKATDIPDLLGQKTTNFTTYKPLPSWEEVLQEARILKRDYHDKNVELKMFINSAYLNITASGWQSKNTLPGKPSKACQEWLQTLPKGQNKDEFKPRLIKK
jgi:hypothetical protein